MPSSLDTRVIVIIPAFPEHQSTARRPPPRPRPRARFKVFKSLRDSTLGAASRRVARISRAMSSGTFGKKAVELVREIADSEPGSIPPYNQDLIRTVIDQCEDHHRELGRLASEYTDATTALEGAADEEEDERQSTQNRVRVGMLAHHQVRRDATDAARDGTGRDAREDSETDSETDDDRSMRRRC